MHYVHSTQQKFSRGCYVNDIYLVWNHGTPALNEFLMELIVNIQFNSEVELT